MKAIGLGQPGYLFEHKGDCLSIDPSTLAPHGQTFAVCDLHASVEGEGQKQTPSNFLHHSPSLKICL